jgi:hypothetical protein
VLVSAASPKLSGYEIVCMQKRKFAMAGTPSPARGPRALPGESNRLQFYHDAIFRTMMLPLA